eukprot:4994462-Karenia_brevis.AAC.1
MGDAGTEWDFAPNGHADQASILKEPSCDTGILTHYFHHHIYQNLTALMGQWLHFGYLVCFIMGLRLTTCRMGRDI